MQRVLTVMLCGAADLADLRLPFIAAVTKFGGEPRTFLDASLPHLNIMGSSWEINSERAVETSDLCVFAVNRQYGSITWLTEMRLAIASKKPFLLFCHSETLSFFRGLVGNGQDPRLITQPNTRQLFIELEKASRDQFTFVPYEVSTFEQDLTKKLSGLLEQGLGALTIRQEETTRRMQAERDKQNARDSIAAALSSPGGSPNFSSSLPDAVTSIVRTVEQQRLEIAELLERNRLAEEDRTKLHRESATRRSVPIPLLVTAFVMGVLLTSLVVYASRGWLTPPPTEASSPPPSASPSAAPSDPEGRRSQEVGLTDFTCSAGDYVSLLGHWDAADEERAELKRSVAVDWRAVRLASDNPPPESAFPDIKLSAFSEKCSAPEAGYGKEANSRGKVYLWSGPFKTKAKAIETCRIYNLYNDNVADSSKVGTHCFAAPI